MDWNCPAALSTDSAVVKVKDAMYHCFVAYAGDAHKPKLMRPTDGTYVCIYLTFFLYYEIVIKMHVNQ